MFFVSIAEPYIEHLVDFVYFQDTHFKRKNVRYHITLPFTAFTICKLPEEQSDSSIPRHQTSPEVMHSL